MSKFIDDREDKSHVMSRADRLKWILDYLDKRPCPYYVNTLNADFVDSYTAATNAPYMIRIIGANTCHTLTRDLSVLHKQGKLDRSVGGIGGMGGMGFPTWIWQYRLKEIVR